MSSVRVTAAPAAARSSQGAVPRPLLLAAAALGLASTAFGAWLFAHPASLLGSDPEVFLVRVLLGARAAAAVVGGLGLVGTIGAVVALVVGPRRRPGLLAVALVEVVGFGVALQSVTTISLAGYLLAMALPLGVLVLAVLVVRRYRRLRWPVLAAVLAAAVAVAVSWTSVSGALARLGQALATGFVTAGPRLGSTVLTGAVVAVWVLVAVRLARGSDAARGSGRWVLRHRRTLTLVAAAGPLPYALVRATWLTPWPMLTPATDLPAEVRLWGLLLGASALVGTVLTLGLVLPWGETFPRWVPRLGGRAVPVAAAVVPGALVGGIVCAAAVPMLRLALLPGSGELGDGLSVSQRLELTLVFPFWLWGPALVLAVWGYALHRAAVAGGGGRDDDARG
jgi:hypothetical protein